MWIVREQAISPLQFQNEGVGAILAVLSDKVPYGSKVFDELGAAENIFVIGYSLPETDAFFRYLFALGSQSSVRLKNLVILNPDKSGETEKRFRNLIGRGIESRFQYLSKGFSEGVVEIARILEEAAR